MSDEEPTALYRFFDSEDQLLYIGISNGPNRRWRQHIEDKPWANEVTMRVFEWLPSRPAAEAAEVRAIKREKPKYNIQHQTKPKKPRLPRQAPQPVPQSAIDRGFLTMADIAFILNIAQPTLRFLRAQSRPGGRYANDPFPEPDLIVARSPAWSEERADEIKAWNKRRPGQGAGGGRPRKTES